MIRNEYTVKDSDRGEFVNNAFFCVGTGRMGLALQQEYLDELKLMQEMVPFSHIRGHGLFCDDMAIYAPVLNEDGTVRAEHYNFTYLDRVFDSYLKLNIKPFLELGFMPSKMASGTQTIFYWKGNTTPPADYSRWSEMISAFITHLIDRYGRNEVASWPCEVWNEPNLPGFWENADLQEYLKLYKVSCLAVKSVLPEMRVGGPAVCGGDRCIPWITAFLNFCRDEHVPVDFVTRHIYMAQTPERRGQYIYHEMCSPSYSIHEAEETRALIDSYPEYRGMELHITEFNTSYNPRCPIHDTIYNGALICALLARIGKFCASYSYWTFGDVFEETGVYDRQYHGGFGLIADHGIPKPTAWAYHFFSKLKGTPLLSSEDTLCVRDENGTYRAVMWNICRDEKQDRQIRLCLPAEKGESYSIVTQVVDRKNANPLRVWHHLGEPATLDREQIMLLKNASAPGIASEKIVCDEDRICVDQLLSPNAFMLVTVKKTVYSYSDGYVYPEKENE